jgi:O-antigen ligase
VAHNSYISVLVEQGIVGFLLYMTMLAMVAVALLKLRTLDRRFALVLLATLGAAMLPLTWEDRRAVWVILAVLAGFAQARLAYPGGVARRPPAPRAVPVVARARAPRPIERPTVPGGSDAPDPTA